jgi:hypothetical protein
VLRYAYVVAAGYVALCSLAVVRGQRAAAAAAAALDSQVVPVRRPAARGAAGWFAGIRPRCNAVEVSLAMTSTPPPADDEGAAYRAGCYALAGKLDDARRVIDGLRREARGGAAQIVFGIVHPVADAGDDKSAGPMMRLVLDYTPDNFMALYHAGMSEYAVDDYPAARVHLRRFLELYRADDGWAGNARSVLGRPEMR